MNRSWTLLDSRNGNPAIKNGVAECLALKEVEDDAVPKYKNQLAISKTGHLLIAIEE